jgi:outer membrane protein assembly factor BamB
MKRRHESSTINMKRIYLQSTILLALASAGCSPAAPEPTFDVPLEEPTRADRPSEMIVADYQQSKRRDDLQTQTDWPFLFGPHRTGATQASIPAVWTDQGPVLRWDVEVGTGYGSPVTAENHIVFSHRVDDLEWIQCHDAQDGAVRWKHSLETDAKCDFEYSDGPYSTPLIDLERRAVYHFSGSGTLVSLDFDTGEEVWRRDLHDEFQVEPDLFPSGATPLLHGEHLILSLGGANNDAGIIAIHVRDGETIWSCTDHKTAYTTPVVAQLFGQEFAFVMSAEGLVCLDPANGEVDWEISHRSRAPMSYNSVSPLVWNDHVLMVTGPGPGAVCLQVLPDRSYEERWKNRRLLDSQYTNLLLSDGHVFGFTSAGQGGAELRCIEFTTGELKWKYHSVLRRAQGLIAGDAMFFLGERGHLASLQRSVEEPRVLSFTQQPLMKAECYCSPAIIENGIVLKDENRVAVYDLGPSGK